MSTNGTRIDNDVMGALRSQVEPLVKEALGDRPLLNHLGKTEKPKRGRVGRKRELSRRFIAYLPDGTRVWGPFKAGNEVVAEMLATNVCGRSVSVKECDRG